MNKYLERCKKVIKDQIRSENTLVDSSSEFTELFNVMKRTVCNNESDSVLVIGPNGCGKTSVSYFLDANFFYLSI